MLTGMQCCQKGIATNHRACVSATALDVQMVIEEWVVFLSSVTDKRQRDKTTTRCGGIASGADERETTDANNKRN